MTSPTSGRPSPAAGRPVLAVVAGGPSSEHDVSLETARCMIATLQGGGWRVRPVLIDGERRWRRGAVGDTVDDVPARCPPLPEAEALERIAADGELVVLALHGPFGEDGQVQRLLDGAGITYTGPGPSASSLCMDKELTKVAASRLGAHCVGHEVLSGTRLPLWGISKGIGYPCVVKPVGAGSSVGVRIVPAEEELEQAVRAAQAADPEGRCMVEEYVAGIEVTCAVLRRDGQLVDLPLVAIRAAAAFYDYDAKYHSEETRYECPARLGDDAAGEIRRHSRALHEALELRGVTRMDWIVPEEGRPAFLELNTLPGFTTHSLVPMAARAAGWSELDVLEAVLADVAPPHGPSETR